MSDPAFASGHCLCGTVTFSIAHPPARMAQCHCDHCQRASGTGHLSIAFFKTEDVSIQGETSAYTSITDTGSELTRHFCTTCGSRLFGTNTARAGIISVMAGVIDDHSWFKPDAIVYNRNKPVWDYMDPDVPTFETMPPPPPKQA